jgi:hypothetical protein
MTERQSEERPTITWTREMLGRFKKAVAAAPGDKDAVFTFDGHQFVKSYAKYLIEYLETRFGSA